MLNILLFFKYIFSSRIYNIKLNLSPTYIPIKIGLWVMRTIIKVNLQYLFYLFEEQINK